MAPLPFLPGMEMVLSFFFQCFNQIKQDSGGTEGSVKGLEDELTCTICLDQVKRGELVRSLPCLHQVYYCLSFAFFNFSVKKNYSAPREISAWFCKYQVYFVSSIPS